MEVGRYTYTDLKICNEKAKIGETVAFVLASDYDVLEARVKEYEDEHRNIMQERCGDEKHCTCVPSLRARVKELEGFIRSINIKEERGVSDGAPDIIYGWWTEYEEVNRQRILGGVK